MIFKTDKNLKYIHLSTSYMKTHDEETKPLVNVVEYKDVSVNLFIQKIHKIDTFLSWSLWDSTHHKTQFSGDLCTLYKQVMYISIKTPRVSRGNLWWT